MTVLETNGTTRRHQAPALAPDLLPDDLPDDRKAAWAAGLAQYEIIAAERDRLIQENTELRNTLSEHRVALEVHQTQVSDMQSRIATATMARDQAVAERAAYETMFISIFAQFRAFKVPAAPLIKESRPAQASHEPDQN